MKFALIWTRFYNFQTFVSVSKITFREDVSMARRRVSGKKLLNNSIEAAARRTDLNKLSDPRLVYTMAVSCGRDTKTAISRHNRATQHQDTRKGVRKRK